MQAIARAVIVALWFSGAAQAQPPTPSQPAAQAPAQPELPEALRLARDNLLLQARVNELETQIAALKAQLINDRIGQAAPALIQKLQAAAPEWDVNPQTLEFTRKAAAATLAPTPQAAPQAPRP